jgi:hypothetical protein
MSNLRKKKKSQQIDVIAKKVYQDFSMAMVNYETTGTGTREKDFTLFLVYDHRINSGLEKIAKQLFEDLLIEESSIFIDLV